MCCLCVLCFLCGLCVFYTPLRRAALYSSRSEPLRMFTPDTFAVALLMMITSTVCWGSCANTFKLTRNYRFELFYCDYAIGIVLISLILALTMGSQGGRDSFLNNASTADT